MVEAQPARHAFPRSAGQAGVVGFHHLAALHGPSRSRVARGIQANLKCKMSGERKGAKHLALQVRLSPPSYAASRWAVKSNKMVEARPARRVVGSQFGSPMEFAVWL